MTDSRRTPSPSFRRKPESSPFNWIPAFAGMTLFALSGCVSLPESRQPAVELPATRPGQAPVARVAPDWWKAYGDPVLDALIDEALAHNADLRLAAARTEEARAALGLAEADRRPQIGASAGVSRTRSTELGSFPVPTAINDKYQAGAQAAYEVDWWGRYRQASAAAKADLLASDAGREVVRLGLTTAVAQAYFALRALDAQDTLARETVANRRQSAALQKLRFEGGEVSELEWRQAEAELAAGESALAQVSRQLGQRENALAALLGRSPRRLAEDMVARGAALNVLTLPPDIPDGLPSDLLARRPDIRQAEQALAAADARIAEARAALYPSLALTASLGSESRALSDLFSGPATVWGLAASLAQTLYNGGRTEAAVQATAARREQALIRYEQTVRQAFREALDALVAHRQAREQAAAENRRAAAQGRALELAELRYRNGVSGYLEVLDAQRNLFAAEQARIEARRLQLAAVADLNAALGGGWAAPEKP